MARSSSPRELPKYCVALMDRVEQQTGRALSLVAVDSERAFEPYLSVSLTGDEPHRLTYWAGVERHRTHYAVTASYSVLRLCETPAEERRVPVMSLDAKRVDELAGRLSTSFPDRGVALVNALNILVGIGQQVTRYPLDLRVERDVQRDVGRHRVAQQKYLRDQGVGIVTALRQPVFQKLPDDIQRTVASLHLAYMRCAANIAGIEDLSFLFPEFLDGSAIDHLVQMFLASDVEGHAGDRVLIDAWAELLGLREWYQWRSIGAGT